LILVESGMEPVPWQSVHSWDCVGCGECCRPYTVSLLWNEWVQIVQTYGIEVTEPSIDGFYLKKKGPDRRCIFQYTFGGRWLCAIQSMKPLACKLWPFKILGKPRYGRQSLSSFPHAGRDLYVYADPFCRGLTYGTPSERLAQKTLPEFIELSRGLRSDQHYSTSTFGPQTSPMYHVARPLYLPYSPRRI